MNNFLFYHTSLNTLLSKKKKKKKKKILAEALKFLLAKSNQIHEVAAFSS